MSDKSSSGLPSWVLKRDGRRVLFDADKISQTLYAVTEESGQPNAFLARELTESVLHFLAQEEPDKFSTTAQIADLVAKIVRELGQPALAQAFAHKHLKPPTVTTNTVTTNTVTTNTVTTKPKRQTTIALTAPSDQDPERFGRECLRQYSLTRVFPRDLVAAQHEGWLSLAGLHHPGQIAGSVLDWPRDAVALTQALVEARQRIGGFVALDSPELTFDPDRAFLPQAEKFLAELCLTLPALGLHALVNVNLSQPPPWSTPSATTPLFQQTPARVDRGAAADALFLASQPIASPFIRIDWHVEEADFVDPARRARLEAVLARAEMRSPVSIVFDRPRRRVALAEGLDRKHEAVLQVVALHLAPLVNMPGVDDTLELFLPKLANLARMAVSAGVQKRHFLRALKADPGELRRGFFLDRARLAVVPLSLQSVAERLTPRGQPVEQTSVNIVRHLRQALEQRGRAANLDVTLDSPWWLERDLETFLPAPHLAGLTHADSQTDPRLQLRDAGAWHAAADAGTATLLLPAERSESLLDLAFFAWKKTDVVRLRFA